MNLIDVGIRWRDRLRWYQRVALVIWWLGIAAFVLSMVVCGWLLLTTDRSSVQQSGAAAALLVGVLILLITRLMVVLVARRRRIRLKRSYY